MCCLTTNQQYYYTASAINSVLNKSEFSI